MTDAIFVCGAAGAPDDAMRVLIGLASCCEGALDIGPSACTCWEVLYDQEQVEPDPTSPEQLGDDRYEQPCEDVSVPFWCHQGMRRAVAYRHSSLGIVVPASGDFYKPPILTDGVGGTVPYRADGSAGARCVGWAGLQRQEVARKVWT